MDANPSRAEDSVGSSAIRLSPVQRVVLLPLYFYRRFITPYTPSTCRFHPTCSLYAIEAIKTHGIFKGSSLALRRILRCHPWHPGGLDPVPQNLAKPVSKSDTQPDPKPNKGA